MSSNVNPPPATATPTQPAAASRSPDEVFVVSHSYIFYWWPVWAVGFIMGILTYVDGHLMVTVPKGTEAVRAEAVNYELPDGKTVGAEKVEVLLVPKGKELSRKTKSGTELQKPHIHMARNKNLGVLFCVTLLLVITITNVPLRGMWSVVVIITIVLLSVIIALAGWWETIVNTLSFLDIRINAGGYFFLSTALFIIWAVATFLFDRQTYIVFTPGQFKVCQSIGEGEKVFDARGLQLERQRGDLFRHYILGLGSGDLVVKTQGAQSHHFDLQNVLWIDRKVKRIEKMLALTGGGQPGAG